MRNFLEFEYSAWFILLCIGLGIAYSYLQYTKSAPWSIRTNQALAALRAIVVSILAFLLLGPMVRAIKNFSEAPIMVVAIDNSESVRYNNDSTELIKLVDKLSTVGEKLSQQGWEVHFQDLNHADINIDSLEFNSPRTDLTKMIRSVQTSFEGANLGGMVVVSDGIFNSGFSPDLISSFLPIYSIGLGDTIPKADLSIIDVQYNKTVYQNNQSPVRVLVRNEGLGPETTTLKLYQSGKLIALQNLSITKQSRLIEHEFLVDADTPGKQRYSIILEPVTGESNSANNNANFYIDVIDGKQKVLILAESPHPDIKALRLAIDKNEHFEVEVLINEAVDISNYDLLITCNSPQISSNSKFYSNLVVQSDIPKLFLVGNETNLSVYREAGIIEFEGRINQFDQVTAVLNEDFTAFNILNDMTDWLSDVPPMTVPFGNLLLPATAQVLLNQKVGSVSTGRPIVYVIEDEVKIGVVLGDGLWKWRLDEFRKYGANDRFDELITKLTKYLAAKPDNRQFKLYPIKDSFESGEELVFVAETYNEIFEPLYGEPLNLVVTGVSNQWRYNFTPLAGSQHIVLDDLPEGLYSYQGSTFLNGKRHQVTGQFSVEKPNLEAADLTADHLLLRKIAKDSGGNFYSKEELDKLENDFSSLELPAIIHSQERELLVMSLPWLLILLVVLVTTEWLTRKMMGGY